jgi:hypothetical protein
MSDQIIFNDGRWQNILSVTCVVTIRQVLEVLLEAINKKKDRVKRKEPRQLILVEIE